MAWPTKKAIRLARVPTVKATTPKTAALAAMTECRWGAAVKVVRIMPVVYSLAIDQHAQYADGELGEQHARQAG